VGFKDYLDGFTAIERGKGYWFNSRHQATYNLENAVMPNVRDNQPAQISLQTGWNQIGNPYPFPINWVAVLAFNNADTKVEALVGYSGTTKTSPTSLGVFESAYVRSSETITLDIPFLSSLLARLRGNKQLRNPISDNEWDLTINLQSGPFRNEIGGVGMRENALDEMDPYDLSSPPRWMNSADIVFRKNDWSPGPKKLTRNVVRTTDLYIWEFDIESNVPEEPVEMSWDNSYFGDNGYQLIMVDQETQELVNMRDQSRYVFHATQRSFKLYYGLSSKIGDVLSPEEITLGRPYPNPSMNKIRIPFTVPENNTNFNIRITIYDLLGSRVAVLTDEDYEQGFYEIEWNGRNQVSDNVAPGIYYVVMDATGNNNNFSKSQKIIRQ